MIVASSLSVHSGLAQKKCCLVTASHSVEILRGQIESCYFPRGEDGVVPVASVRPCIEERNVKPVLLTAPKLESTRVVNGSSDRKSGLFGQVIHAFARMNVQVSRGVQLDPVCPIGLPGE